ncbi:hypothetical protein C1E24_03945 [Pseudoalteromonas phenolica]|uniref:Uncharacterized protein n=1 Tax=Pseudoalteromonas phenolica TaxID=161398 RepID=A0A5R9Q4U7_9GAMM|nr:hypothetical protein C1E24_03945 [Pseudoalteromonas phenolica]|tara:strand:- start:265 stop:486 length:222 start_codon:yes stop_codon:yes gene_type:complete
MAKQVFKPSSYFLAAFCFLALLVFNMIEDNIYSVMLFFCLFFLSLLFGINQRFNLLKFKEQKTKKPTTFNTFQ